MATDERIARRVGALHLARRRGSVSIGAWAAARLRLPGVKLDPADARFAHQTVVRYGHSLRMSRQKRSAIGDVLVEPIHVARSPRRWLAFVAGAVLIIVAVVALLLASRPIDRGQVTPGGGTPIGAGNAPTASPLRGRSDVAIVVPVTTPQPTPAPTEEPSATPAPTTATGRPGGVSGGSGTGGSGGGSGGGTGIGTGTGSGAGVASPTPTATPTPVPTPTPTVDPATIMTLRGRVVDLLTGKGVPNTCVAPGLLSCIGDTVVFTDANGYWQLVLSIGQDWDIDFIKAGYYSSMIHVRSQAGVHYVPDVLLRPLGH